MRILFVGEMNRNGRCYQRMAAMRDLGHTVDECPYVPPETALDAKPSLLQRVFWKLGFPLDAYRVNDRILEAAQRASFDLLWVEKGNVVLRSTLGSFRRIHPAAKIVSYSEDDMFFRKNRSFYYLRGLPEYDTVFTTKSYNCDPGELPALGARRTLFVDKAYDRNSHYGVPVTAQEREQYGADVGFIGTFEAPRAQSMALLARNGIRVRVWGSGWEGFDAPAGMRVEGRGLYGEDYRKGMCASRINLCFLRKANRDLQTDRTMELPAAEAFMLAERTDEHLRLFTEGEEAAYFGSDQELLEKVRYYLAHEEERLRIARAGRRRCEASGYSHHDRLQWMLERV